MQTIIQLNLNKFIDILLSLKITLHICTYLIILTNNVYSFLKIDGVCLQEVPYFIIIIWVPCI